MATIDEAYEQAKDSMPSLRASFNREFNQWSELAKAKATVRGFETDEFGGRKALASLAKAVFSVPEVRTAGDTNCRTFYPGAYFTDVAPAVDGANVKADLSRAPAILAITDLQVILVVRVGSGWSELLAPRHFVANPRWITVGGALVQPKFWCLQFDTLMDSERSTDTICLGRGDTADVQTRIRADVEQALTANQLPRVEQRPPAPAQEFPAPRAPAEPQNPARWLPDPHQRHEWTQHVSNNGVAGVDPT